MTAGKGHAAGNHLEITTSDRSISTLRDLRAGRVSTATAVFADLLEHVSAVEGAELEPGLTHMPSVATAPPLFARLINIKTS